MPRLIRIFAGRPCHFVGFDMPQLNMLDIYGINGQGIIMTLLKWYYLKPSDKTNTHLIKGGDLD